MYNNEKNILSIGYGEVGKAISQICEDSGFDVFMIDKELKINEIEELEKSVKENISFKATHINFPYFNEDFINYVVEYSIKYPTELIIVNSSVPVGTTEKIYKRTGIECIHSPIRGVHPNLYKGIKTFVKYIGPTSEKSKELAESHFKKLKLKTRVMKSSKETELAKLLSTTSYGIWIVWTSYIKNLCDNNNIDFGDVHNEWTKSYNNGYQKLNMKDVSRPILYPCDDKIGGHCVIPNSDLIQKNLLMLTDMQDMIKKIKKLGN